MSYVGEVKIVLRLRRFYQMFQRSSRQPETVFQICDGVSWNESRPDDRNASRIPSCFVWFITT